MTNFTFSPKSITVKGKTFLCEYSITPAGTVFCFVDDGTERVRIRINPEHELYAAAYAAALAARNEDEQEAPVAVGETPTAAQEAPAPAETAPAPAADPVPVAKAETAAADPKAAHGPTPEKTFIGQTITGNGWRILFDGEAQRTRVIFAAEPTDAARAALAGAGFYYSGKMQSYNKKLSFKAYRAAQALSAELAALYA